MGGNHRAGINTRTTTDIEQMRFVGQVWSEGLGQLLAEGKSAAVHDLGKAPREILIEH